MGRILDALEKAAREKGLGMPAPEPEKERQKEEKVQVSLDTPSALFTPDRPSLDPRLVAVVDSQSPIAEQFRKLRSAIIHTRNGAPPRAIMITSALANEGKTFVAANLAASIAKGIHERVLLVDCDFRRPEVHNYFGIKAPVGLSAYLRGDAELSRLFVKTSVEKLSLLPMGAPPPNPSELTASEKMKALMAEMKGRYPDRYLVIDSTPLVPTTEPSILASQVDGVVLVIRAEKTSRDMVEKALESLASVRVLGIVLNDVRPAFPQYYYRNRVG